MAFPKKSNFARFHKREPGSKNRVETAYEEYLTLLKAAGEIQDFKYEGIKLRLADNTFYTPDFLVFAADGVVELHDTKGTTKKANAAGVKVPKAWVEEDAKLKIKVVAELFPFRTFIVWKSEGQWIKEQF
jgi:hypothetical protein